MKKSLIVLALALSGCAKVSDYQASCEQRYSRFSEMATCLDTSVNNDSRMAKAATPKMYVLAAKLLGQKVDNGEISDIQARLELQSLYVSMQRQQEADEAARGRSIQQSILNAQAVNTLQSIQQKNNQSIYVPPPQAPIQNSIRTTNCTRYGNTVNCNSY